MTLQKVVEAEEAEKKLDKAVRAGIVRRFHGSDWFAEAQQKGVITESEAELLRETEALVARVIAVDHFDPAELKPNYAVLGHKSGVDNATPPNETSPFRTTIVSTAMSQDMSALKDWRFEIDREGIAWAIFDREGQSANALGRRPIEELRPDRRAGRAGRA